MPAQAVGGAPDTAAPHRLLKLPLTMPRASVGGLEEILLDPEETKVHRIYGNPIL